MIPPPPSFLAGSVESLIDFFESQVHEHGIDAIHVRDVIDHWQHSHPQATKEDLSSNTTVAIELLRVWMEYRAEAGHATSVADALAQFPHLDFEQSALDLLHFEHRRLLQHTTTTSADSPEMHATLPQVATQWENFELLAELGAGGLARVFLARQLTMANRLVALKLTTRVTQESQRLARLQHSAIVPIYSIHQEGDVYGVCMPYLGNTTLADLLRDLRREYPSAGGDAIETTDVPTFADGGGQALLTRLQRRETELETVLEQRDSRETIDASHPAIPARAPIASPDETLAEPTSPTLNEAKRTPTARELAKLTHLESVIWIGMQLAGALDHAHRLGVVHCDIKPANVLLGSDGQPRLLDFNVSLDQNLATTPEIHPPDTRGPNTRGLIGGTPGYMSPEHRRLVQGDSRAEVDGRADLFSLGAVLFELLTGRQPQVSTNNSASEIAEQLASANRAVSPALRAIVGKCLAPNRELRYQSASDLSEDLHAQLHHRPLRHQREPSLTERLKKWQRRHPRVTSSGGLSIFAALVVTLVVMWGLQIRASRNAFRLQLDESRLVSMLPAAISVASAAVEFDELQNTARKDADHIAQLLDRVAGQHVTGHAHDSNFEPALRANLAIYANTLQDLEERLANSTNPRDTVANPSATRWQVPASIADLPGTAPHDSGTLTLYEMYARQDFSGAVELAKSGELKLGSNYAAWLFLGHSQLKSGDFAAAAESYSAAIALQPTIGIARFYRGICHLKAKRFDQAVLDFQTVVASHPDFMEARFNLAQSLKQRGDLNAAEEQLTLAIDRGWHTVFGYYTRGSIRRQLGNREGSLDDMTRAMTQRLRSEADCVQMGLLTLRTAPEQAAEFFQQAVRKFPNSLAARQNLAHVLSESLNQPEDALDVLGELVKMDPQNPERYAGRAVLLARQGHAQAALDDLEAASRLKPTTPIIQYQIACGYSLLATPAEASKPADAEVSPQLERSDLESQALAWLRSALRSQPSLINLADTDPDLAGLRALPSYANIQQALHELYRNASHD